MPIIGLTTDIQVGAGLPLIAKLYKGGEKPEQGNRPGKDLDYFRVEFESQFEHLKPLWLEMYGEEPDEFEPVLLSAPTVHEAFSSWKEEWTATAMLHQCDGEQQNRWYNTDLQAYSTAKIKCHSTHETKPCECKPIGRLNLILPDFIAEAGVLGYISISTHSLYDILTVYRYLADIERICGRLTGIPFVFGRADKQVSVPKQVKRGGDYVKDGRMKTTKSLFYLHATQDFTQNTILPMLTGTKAVAALPEPKPAIDVEKAKARLGNGGSNGARRMGYVPTEQTVKDDEVIEGVIALENGTETNEKATPDVLPLETVSVPTTAQNAVKAPKSYKIAELYNAVLKSVYKNDNGRMKEQIAKFEETGVLTSDMTTESAIDAVRLFGGDKEQAAS